MRNQSVFSHIPPSVAVVMIVGIPLSFLFFVIVCGIIATHPSPAAPSTSPSAPVGYHPAIPENETSHAWDNELRAAHEHGDYFIGRTATGEYGIYHWDFRRHSTTRDNDYQIVRYTVDERRGTFTAAYR